MLQIENALDLRHDESKRAKGRDLGEAADRHATVDGGQPEARLAPIWDRPSAIPAK